MRDEAEASANFTRNKSIEEDDEMTSEIEDGEEVETDEQFGWDDTHGVYPNEQGWYIEQPLRVMATGNVTNNVVETYSPTSSECDYSDMPPLVSDVSSDSD